MATNLVPPVPYSAAIGDQDKGFLVPPVWADWFKQVFARVGGHLPVALPLQTVTTASSAVATGTTTVPYDDTIPQNTEGTEFLTAAITPRGESNRLVIEAVLILSCSAASRQVIAALFQDSVASALAATSAIVSEANGTLTLLLRHEMAAGTLEEITFKVRSGADSAATLTLNGSGGVRVFGGVAASSLRVTEVAA